MSSVEVSATACDVVRATIWLVVNAFKFDVVNAATWLLDNAVICVVNKASKLVVDKAFRSDVVIFATCDVVIAVRLVVLRLLA